ncbi:MAG TPA: hypothetical protein VJ965_07215 [Anaerolineales bacterium]|nr:hypothetical protein [Anaerolineales bacterium]
MLIKKHILISITLLTLCGVAAACGSTPETTASTVSDASTIVLAQADEPGQRLMLTGTVVDSQTSEPIPGTEIHLYHADANGEYQPSDPADESTARLSGTVFTDENGAFAVDTIVPREYDQPGNRHIHLHTVQAEGYQNGGGVILFENDVNSEIRQWASDTGFGTIIELEDNDGIQYGNIVIPLDPAE